MLSVYQAALRISSASIPSRMLKTTRDDLFVLLVCMTIAVYVSHKASAKSLLFVITAVGLYGTFVYTRETHKDIIPDSRRNYIRDLVGIDIQYVPMSVIDIFYDSYIFYDYNPRVYTVTLKHINNFMHLASDFQKGDISECKNTVQIARGLYLDAMNSFHSLVISVPSVKGDILNKLHKKNMNALQAVLYSELLVMRKLCGITVPDTDGMYSETALLGESDTSYNVFV